MTKILASYMSTRRVLLVQGFSLAGSDSLPCVLTCRWNCVRVSRSVQHGQWCRQAYGVPFRDGFFPGDFCCGLAARCVQSPSVHALFDCERALSLELHATTEEEWRRRHSSQGHKPGPAAVLDTCASGRRVSFNAQNRRLPRGEKAGTLWLNEGVIGLNHDMLRRDPLAQLARQSGLNKDMLNEGHRPENPWAPTPRPVFWQVSPSFLTLQVCASCLLRPTVACPSPSPTWSRRTLEVRVALKLVGRCGIGCSGRGVRHDASFRQCFCRCLRTVAFSCPSTAGLVYCHVLVFLTVVSFGPVSEGSSAFC